MRAAICTSISAGCAALAKATTPSKVAYCLRHGYSLVLVNRPYDEAVVEGLRDIWRLLDDDYELVWSLDADCLITGTAPIHALPELGHHVTVCEEQIVGWNRINCGSMVWRNTDRTRIVLGEILAAESHWRRMPCLWQSWLAEQGSLLGDAVTVARQRAFNSVAWNHSGGGSHWQPGDLVYHPCGIVPHELRAEALRDVAATLEAAP